jgi:hypothetical protein
MMFQMRSIGTQEITINTVVGTPDAHTIARNSQAIFRMSGYKAQQREDGQWDVQITLTPDNGMASVENDSPVANCASQ